MKVVILALLTTIITAQAVYVKHETSQCNTNSAPYVGDRLDNPIFNGGGFIGQMTGSECEAECTNPANVDSRGRPCVAFEHSSQDYDAVANCALAWACDYTSPWHAGASYIWADRIGQECWNQGCWGNTGEICDWCGTHNGQAQICCNGRADYTNNHANCAGAEYTSSIWGHQCVVKKELNCQEIFSQAHHVCSWEDGDHCLVNTNGADSSKGTGATCEDYCEEHGLQCQDAWLSGQSSWACYQQSLVDCEDSFNGSHFLCKCIP